MPVSQFHTHARHTFHVIRKSRGLFDCSVTAVSLLREAAPTVHATITWIYLANSVRRDVCWDMTADMPGTDACCYKYFMMFSVSEKLNTSWWWFAREDLGEFGGKRRKVEISFFFIKALRSSEKLATAHTVNWYHSSSSSSSSGGETQPVTTECGTAIRKGVNEGKNNRSFVGTENKKWAGREGLLKEG